MGHRGYIGQRNFSPGSRGSRETDSFGKESRPALWTAKDSTILWPEGGFNSPGGGQVVTEIESFRILAGVETFHVASGGCAGSEGAVTLVAEGEARNGKQGDPHCGIP